MCGCNVFTEGIKGSRDLLPRIAFDHQCASGRAELFSPCLAAQERYDRSRKFLGTVCGNELLARRQREPLGSNGRRYDRLGHAESLENLHPRSAPRPQRHNIDRSLLQIWTHIVYGAGHDHSEPLGRISQLLRRVPPDHGEGRARKMDANVRQDRFTKVNNGVFVRMPVHRAAEHEASRDF
jgi:hypothetical protein